MTDTNMGGVFLARVQFQPQDIPHFEVGAGPPVQDVWRGTPVSQCLTVHHLFCSKHWSSLGRV